MTNISQKKLKSLKPIKFPKLSLCQRLEERSKKDRKSISGKFIDFILKN